MNNNVLHSGKLLGDAKTVGATVVLYLGKLPGIPIGEGYEMFST